MIIPPSAQAVLKLQRSVGDFEEQLKKEFQEMKSYLPKFAYKIWDIGAGLAGIDLLLNEHYKNETLFYLSDYDKIDKDIFFGFNEKYCAYSTFNITREFLNANGMDNFCFDNIESNYTNRPHKAEIVLSLLSCGFHYPVLEYRDEIIDRTKKGSILIIDMRKDYDQREDLLQWFNELAYIEHRKWYRFIGVRK